MSRRPCGDAGRGRQQPQGERDDGDPDREVDEEDPLPAEHVRENSAEQDPDAPAAGGDEPEDAHRLGALGRLGEEHHHQRERDGGDDRAPETLDRP